MTSLSCVSSHETDPAARSEHLLIVRARFLRRRAKVHFCCHIHAVCPSHVIGENGHPGPTPQQVPNARTRLPASERPKAAGHPYRLNRLPRMTIFGA